MVVVVVSAEEVLLESGNKQVPTWAQCHFDPNGVKAIREAVAQAEQTTSGEIVVVVARRSSAVGHVPFLNFCLAFLVLLSTGSGDWLGDQLLHFGVNMPFVGVSMITLLAGIWGWKASQIPAIQRALIVPFDQESQVQQRAELEFYNAKVHRTGSGTGILLFVSMMEHRVVVLADRGISEKLPATTWNELVVTILSGIKSKQASQGMVAAVKRCGELLSQHFPLAKSDKNELHDEMIFRD